MKRLGASLLLFFAAYAHAITGDPVPGVDVSIEQIPGGMVTAGKTDRDGTTVMTETSDLSPTHPYRAVIVVPPGAGSNLKLQMKSIKQ